MGSFRTVPSTDLSEWMSIKELVDHTAADSNLPVIKEATLRWLIRGRQLNGFDFCVARFGRGLLIHIPSMLKFLDDRRDGVHDE